MTLEAQSTAGDGQETDPAAHDTSGTKSTDAFKNSGLPFWIWLVIFSVFVLVVAAIWFVNKRFCGASHAENYHAVANSMQ